MTLLRARRQYTYTYMMCSGRPYGSGICYTVYVYNDNNNDIRQFYKRESSSILYRGKKETFYHAYLYI